jgi:hypothetical protein
MDKVTTVLMTILQYISALVIAARNAWNQYLPRPVIEDATHPHRRFFLGANSEDIESYTTVPEGKIYVEEWVHGDTKRCVIRYGGEEIPKTWATTPFQKHAKTPWVWIGDRETEIDLTRTFNKYLVVGNVIKMELVTHLIQVNERSNLLYIESGTFSELKFPGDGITIVEYDDQKPV